MKKLILTFAIVGILFSFKSFAEPTSKNVLQIINKEFKYPQKAIESMLQGEVYVSFSLNSLGDVTINSTNGMDEELKTYVVKELMKIKFPKNAVTDEEEFNVKFSLQLK
jgi:capsule polysaccharide modification protein KpsS